MVYYTGTDVSGMYLCAYTVVYSSINTGDPRMPLVLVREFESRRGEILTFFAKNKKGSITAESAYT